MIRGKEMQRALAEATARHKAQREERARLTKLVIEDVLDGTCESSVVAAQGRGVSSEAVRKGVKAAREAQARREAELLAGVLS